MSDKNNCCSPNSSHVSRPCVGDTFMLHQSLRHWKSVLFPSVMLMNTEAMLYENPHTLRLIKWSAFIWCNYGRCVSFIAVGLTKPRALHLGRTAQAQSCPSCMGTFIHFKTRPVSPAFLACRSALVFTRGSARLKLNSPSYWLPLFHRVIPRPSVARFLVSGRCEAHLRRSRHALWLHLSPNMSARWAAVVRRAGASCFLASLSQSEDETQQRRPLRGGARGGRVPPAEEAKVISVVRVAPNKRWRKYSGLLSKSKQCGGVCSQLNLF